MQQSRSQSRRGQRSSRPDTTSSVARYQYLPSFALDFFYGIDANQFAARTDYPTQATGRSTLPNYEVTDRQNLGYVAQATLNIPVWNWGATRSKIKQAEYKQEQAQLDLSLRSERCRAILRRGLRRGAGGAGADRFAAQLRRSCRGKSAADAAALPGRRGDGARSGGCAEHA